MIVSLLTLFLLPAAPLFAASSRVSLPSYLSVARPADRAWMAKVVQQAQASPTALHVLAEVAKIAEQRGRPVVVEIAKTSANSYDYDSHVVSLRRGNIKKGALASVPVLIHELQHMLQSNQPLPSDLLETELEAYVVDFQVSQELGYRPPRGSYDARAQRQFRRGLEPFVAFLRKEYPADTMLRGTSSRDYERKTRESLEAATTMIERLKKRRASHARVLAQMERLGQPRAQRRAYEIDTLAPLEAGLDVARRWRAWAAHDLAIMANPEGRRNARRYVRSVMRRARAFQKKIGE